jgi:hypothetical protein
MKLLCFQAKRFRWKAHSKILPEALPQDSDQEVSDAVVVFLHAEVADANGERAASVLRQTVKHIKWLAHKRGLKNVVVHSFAHLGGETSPADFARSFMDQLGSRLRASDYRVSSTPFGCSCEWDLSVHGENLAKVWKEIR